MTPTFQILAGGSDISGAVSSRLISLEITDTVDETSDGFSLVLEDSSGTLAMPASGAKIEIALGYNGANERVGSFVVDEVEIFGPPDIVSVQGSSTPFVTDRGGGGQAAFTSRKSRSFEDKTISEIVQSVASECGLTPVVDSALASIQIPHIAQCDESDANLLVRIARRYGGVLKPADGRLVLASEAGGVTTSGAALVATLTPAMVTSWRAKQGGKSQGVTKVKSRSYSYEAAESTEHEEKVGDGQFNFAAPEGATSEQLDVFYQAVLDNDAASPTEAKATAKSQAKRIERSKKSVEVTMPGTLAIVAGAVVNLSGFRDGVAGRYKAVQVRHTLSRSGWTTTISGEGA